MMGMSMQENGVIFVAPDYRNFPEVSASKMVGDVELAIQWVLNHIDELGGDKHRVSLVGQSAGAHLSALAIV